MGERAHADPADHHVAAGFNALGDGDFALARQQLDRAHLAQVHADRIVGAADIGIVEIADGAGFFPARRPRRAGLALGFVLLLVLDDIDAHVVQHGMDVSI